MISDFDILRALWVPKDYEGARDSYLAVLEQLDVEELTLLEFCSYEYQTALEESEYQEERFRSQLRLQRRLSLEKAISDIREGSRDIYSLGHKHDDPRFLLQFVLKLSSQNDNTISI